MNGKGDTRDDRTSWMEEEEEEEEDVIIFYALPGSESHAICNMFVQPL